MNHSDFNMDITKPILPFNVKDVLAIGFRYKRTAMLCFLGIMAGAILAAIFQPAEYRASTTFLVGEGRVDPVVTTEATVQPQVKTVSEEDLNSEVELLHSPDVLRQVVVNCGLDQHKTLLDHIFGMPDANRRVARATNKLGKELQIQVVKKSDLIEVGYTARDPQLSMQVLKALTDSYMQKHAAVHTPPGQFDFFAQETERYKKNLSDAEAQLKQFSQEDGGVAPQVSRDITLQKLSEFRATLQQTRAQIAATQERIKTLEKQAGITPERYTTATRQSDDAQVLQSLKATLMNLQLKRTELLTKYQPTYPLVQEVDKEIGDTQAAIVAEEAKPLKEQTTDRNPTYSWITEELAKAKAEYSSLLASEAAMETTVKQYEDRAHDLAQKGLTEQDLLRTVKTDEENYLLYLHKEEQARMDEALDRTRILNVAVAEQPSAPSLPSNSPWPLLFAGIFFAGLAAAAAVAAQYYIDPSFRTPEEVAAELNVPLLAAVPHAASGHYRNGNGNVNGDGFRRERDFAIPESDPVSHVG